MEEERRDAREDISYIRRILERTADGMRSVAPWLTRLGIVWLVYGLLSLGQRIILENAAPAAAATVSTAGSVLAWLFYGVLALGYLLGRRRLAELGRETLALKLVDVWGASILLFIALSICLLAVVPGVAIRGLGIGPMEADGLSRACSVGQGCLFFVLPMLPLIVTAIFLERRRTLWVCSVLAVLAVAILCCHAVLLFYAGNLGGRAWSLGWTAAAGLMDIAPGVILMLFGRALKRG